MLLFYRAVLDDNHVFHTKRITMIPNVHEQIPKFQELAPEADLYDGLKMILQAEPLKQNYS